MITHTDEVITLTQKHQCNKIKTVDLTATRKELKDQYIQQHARGAYIATMSQSEAAFSLLFTAQISNSDIDNAKYLNKHLWWQLNNKQHGIKFFKLNNDNLKLYVFVDVFFINNRDYSLQIEFVIVLENEHQQQQEQQQ